jgi:antitoxin CcdA
MQECMYIICMTGTVVVRVDEGLKKKAKAYNVNISEVVRTALKEEVQKRERRELISAFERAKKALSKVPDEEIVKAIREARDER